MPVQKPDSDLWLQDTRHSPAPSKVCCPAVSASDSPFHKLTEVLDQLACLLRRIRLDEQTQDRLGSGKAYQCPVVLAQVKLRSIGMGDFDDRSEERPRGDQRR